MQAWYGSDTVSNATAYLYTFPAHQREPHLPPKLATSFLTVAYDIDESQQLEDVLIRYKLCMSRNGTREHAYVHRTAHPIFRRRTNSRSNTADFIHTRGESQNSRAFSRKARARSSKPLSHSSLTAASDSRSLF